MNEKLFSTERNLFQQQVNEIANEKLTSNVISDLIKLQMAKEAEKNDKMLPLPEIYSLLGASKFTELVELMNGRTVSFPKSENFKETIQVAICFYYKYLKQMKWDKIKKILDDEDFSSIRLGIRTNHLHQFINKMSQIVAQRKSGESK